MPITPTTGWTTSDGQFFRDSGDAEEHQRELDFRAWCDANICRGGEWTARMVADAILEDWFLTPVPKT